MSLPSLRHAASRSSLVHRLLPRVLPQVGLHAHTRQHASSAVAQTPAAADSATPMVSDRIVHLTAIDADGQRHEVKGLAGRTLLSALIRADLESSRRHSLEELESCNGNCEVSIAKEWLDKLPPRTPAEEARLRAVSSTGQVGGSSRLGCQVLLSKELEGMTVAMAEERPWYTL